MRSRQRVIALVLVCLAGASVARAQGDVDPGANARFRFGALRFTPSIALSNVGIDSNVFNEPSDPKQDTVGAVGPAVDLWLKLGRSRLSGKVSGQYLYFDKYDNQRAWNTANEGRWEIPLARITPFLSGAFSDTKDRPGYEIDARVRQKLRSGGFGTTVRLSGKTDLTVGARRTTLDYVDNDVFLGSAIADTLNRRTDAEDLQLRVRLTPLTTFAVRGQATQERFDTAVSRNADTVSVMPGFEFRPEALISGTAFVGVKRFNALREPIPDFTGVVASVSTKYTVRSTRLEFRAARDLAFSYEILEPYYALTDLGLTLTERITTKWDFIGRSSWQSLAYRSVTLVQDTDHRTDHSWLLGGGIGYRMAESLRLGVDANYYRRKTASQAFRNYEGLRIGASFSYGLPQ